MLKKIFGIKKDDEVVETPQECIAKLLEIEEMLVKKQDYFEKKIQQVSLTFIFFVSCFYLF